MASSICSPTNGTTDINAPPTLKGTVTTLVTTHPYENNINNINSLFI